MQKQNKVQNAAHSNNTALTLHVATAKNTAARNTLAKRIRAMRSALAASKQTQNVAASTMRATTKKAQVLAMLQAAPTSVAQISFTLAISTTAAASLIGDLKRAKINVVSTKSAAQNSVHYSVA
jgi:hypothetical protein